SSPRRRASTDPSSGPAETVAPVSQPDRQRNFSAREASAQRKSRARQAPRASGTSRDPRDLSSGSQVRALLDAELDRSRVRTARDEQEAGGGQRHIKCACEGAARALTTLNSPPVARAGFGVRFQAI